MAECPLTLQDAISLINEYWNETQGIWNFHVTAVFATLGVIVTTRQYFTRGLGVVAAVAFGFFASTTWHGLRSVYDRRELLTDCVSFGFIKSHLDVFGQDSLLQIGLMHLASDLLVIGVILFLTWNAGDQPQTTRRHKHSG